MFLFAQEVTDMLSQPWPWYVSGALIVLVMQLLVFNGKSFGVSASMRAACSAMGAGKSVSFFDFDWKGSQGWNMLFITGAAIGGFISMQFLSGDEPMELGAKTIEYVESIGFSAPTATNGKTDLLPQEINDPNFVFSAKGLFILIFGGLLIGFGARYAGGCTSGHAISGLSQLQIPSLIAVIGFFIGGLTMTYFILPLLFGA